MCPSVCPSGHVSSGTIPARCFINLILYAYNISNTWTSSIMVDDQLFFGSVMPLGYNKFMENGLFSAKK